MNHIEDELHVVLTQDDVQDDRDDNVPKVAVDEIVNKLAKLQRESQPVEQIVVDIKQLSLVSLIGVHTLLGIRSRTNKQIVLKNISEGARERLNRIKVLGDIFEEEEERA